MPEILLRARKDPFQVLSPEDVLLRNGIAENAGNLIFSMAAHRVLETATTRVVADSFEVSHRSADAINERYAAYVLPFANAFRLSFERHLIAYTRLIRRLRIPVVILGVGAQSNVRYDLSRLRPIERSVRDFVSAVLDRAPSIGVRGELTRDYLVGLGFRDVEVVGCPSMFLHGPDLHVERRRPTLEPDARLAINVSPYVSSMGPVVAHHLARYPNLTYIAQDLDTLEMLLWGDERSYVDADDPRPIHLAHPLFREDRVRLFVDPAPWIEHLRGFDFSFGTRIHGNIAALLAGTPAVVLAHDSRTLELARYFDIPHRLMRDVRPDTDAATLYEEADFGALNRGHAARFATFTAFLDRHGLDHIFRSPEPQPDFDTRLAATPYPPPVTFASRTVPHGVSGRVKRTRRQARRLLRHPWIRRTRTTLARGLGRREAAPAD